MHTDRQTNERGQTHLPPPLSEITIKCALRDQHRRQMLIYQRILSDLLKNGYCQQNHSYKRIGRRRVVKVLRLVIFYRHDI